MAPGDAGHAIARAAAAQYAAVPHWPTDGQVTAAALALRLDRRDCAWVADRYAAWIAAAAASAAATLDAEIMVALHAADLAPVPPLPIPLQFRAAWLQSKLPATGVEFGVAWLGSPHEPGLAVTWRAMLAVGAAQGRRMKGYSPIFRTERQI